MTKPSLAKDGEKYGKMRTFEELKRELDKSGRLEIEPVSGLYWVCLPQNFQVVITPTTDAIPIYRGRNMLYAAELLRDKYEGLCAAGQDGGRLLYLGKADRGRSRGLRKRITEFVRYGYGLGSNHRGGRAIWQLEQNKQLLLGYVPWEAPSEEEHRRLREFRERNGAYPLANWKG